MQRNHVALCMAKYRGAKGEPVGHQGDFSWCKGGKLRYTCGIIVLQGEKLRYTGEIMVVQGGKTTVYYTSSINYCGAKVENCGIQVELLWCKGGNCSTQVKSLWCKGGKLRCAAEILAALKESAMRRGCKGGKVRYAEKWLWCKGGSCRVQGICCWTAKAPLGTRRLGGCGPMAELDAPAPAPPPLLRLFAGCMADAAAVGGSGCGAAKECRFFHRKNNAVIMCT